MRKSKQTKLKTIPLSKSNLNKEVSKNQIPLSKKALLKCFGNVQSQF